MLARGDKSPAQVQRARATAAIVVRIEDGNTGQTNLAQHSLPCSRPGVSVAGDGRRHIRVVNARDFQSITHSGAAKVNVTGDFI